MFDFSKFDTQIDTKALENKRAEALNNERTFKDVPAGRYFATIENMEVGETKDGRPMFKVQMRIKDGYGEEETLYLSHYKSKKPCIFMNRVMFGTKNDANMIASVEGWLGKIFPEDPIVFETYSQFANEVMDAAEDCEGLEFDIYYNPAEFNSISIINVN